MTILTQIDPQIAAQLGIRDHDGWTGPFTQERAKGARHANGARIIKRNSEKGDSVPDGTEGTVLGSIEAGPGSYGYFVEWGPMPKHAVFVVARKLGTPP